MKCECRRCSGNGEIVCPDCRGQGSFDADIRTAVLHEKMDHFVELEALQKDAYRVTRQAQQLAAMNPDRKGSYDHQLTAALGEIERQAGKLRKI